MRLTTSDAYGGGSARASDGVSLRHRASELRRGARGPREEVAQDVRGEAPDDGLRLRAAGLIRHASVQVEERASPHVTADRELAPW